MRKAILLSFGVVTLVAFALVPHEAGAVKLSPEQVKTVCGSKLQSSGGAMGCTKACGLNGEHICDFGCYKGDCNGSCMTCGVKNVHAMFPRIYANRVVRQTLGH
jgi:hypothetical protein